MLNVSNMLAQSVGDTSSWLPVVLMIVIGVGFAVGNVALSILVGPSRTGPGKETTYESGMVPIGDTRRRFNVRFYLVAITFVVFDVEVVFLYPWASAYSKALLGANGGLMLVGMLVFVAVILVGFIYEWGKGVFRWD